MKKKKSNGNDKTQGHIVKSRIKFQKSSMEGTTEVYFVGMNSTNLKLVHPGLLDQKISFHIGLPVSKSVVHLKWCK